MELLLRCDPTGAMVGNNVGGTPFHVAAEKGHHDIVSLLLRYCPEGIRVPNRIGETPYHVAVASNHRTIAAVLRKVT